jgi:hypothetical protein
MEMNHSSGINYSERTDYEIFFLKADAFILLRPTGLLYYDPCGYYITIHVCPVCFGLLHKIHLSAASVLNIAELCHYICARKIQLHNVPDNVLID